MRRVGGEINDELHLKGPSELLSTEDGSACGVEAAANGGAPRFSE